MYYTSFFSVLRVGLVNIWFSFFSLHEHLSEWNSFADVNCSRAQIDKKKKENWLFKKWNTLNWYLIIISIQDKSLFVSYEIFVLCYDKMIGHTLIYSTLTSKNNLFFASKEKSINRYKNNYCYTVLKFRERKIKRIHYKSCLKINNKDAMCCRGY